MASKGWNELAEEEWYESHVVSIQKDYDNHEGWCPICDWSASCFCRRGQRIVDQLVAMKENLRKVRLKNRLG